MSSNINTVKKSRQRLFFEKVQSHYSKPETHIIVRCSAASDGTSWSVYCTHFPDEVAPYHWSSEYPTLRDLETWFDEALGSKTAHAVDTIECEESADSPVLSADKTEKASEEKAYPL